MSQEPRQSPPVPPRPESDAGPAPSPTGRGSREGTPWYRARATLILGAWLVAILAVGGMFLAAPGFPGLPTAEVPTLIMLFPSGLVRILWGVARILGLNPLDSLSGPVFFAAWVTYVLLTIALFFVPQGRAFRTLYVVLLVLLALNIGGCHVILMHR